LKAYVLDASVAAKRVLSSHGESLFAEAVRLRDRYACGDVPAYFWPEMGDLSWKIGSARPDGRSPGIRVSRLVAVSGIPLSSPMSA
jgi:hypothetical protein